MLYGLDSWQLLLFSTIFIFSPTLLSDRGLYQVLQGINTSTPWPASDIESMVQDKLKMLVHH